MIYGSQDRRAKESNECFRFFYLAPENPAIRDLLLLFIRCSPSAPFSVISVNLFGSWPAVLAPIRLPRDGALSLRKGMLFVAAFC